MAQFSGDFGGLDPEGAVANCRSTGSSESRIRLNWTRVVYVSGTTLVFAARFRTDGASSRLALGGVDHGIVGKGTPAEARSQIVHLTTAVNRQSTPKTAISTRVKNDTNLFTINAPPDYPARPG